MKKNLFTSIFLVTEAILYYLIMTKGGSLLVWSSFVSIVICFLFVLINSKKADKFILFALFLTVCADYFLVIASPVNRLGGMLFFMVAQTLYAVTLHKKKSKNSEATNKKYIIARIFTVIVAILICFAVLKSNVDMLAVVSIYYYANLLFNIVLSFSMGRKNVAFSIGLVLLLLCDTVIGLQVAAGNYLPIYEGDFIYSIIFTDFFLSWFFYLPSQVIIALTGARTFFKIQ